MKLSPLAVVLGIAGLIPFIFCGLGVLTTPDPDAAKWLLALTAYGAVILAFLGGVHWGLALVDTNDTVIDAPTPGQNRMRLVLGVMPSLIGWFAVVSTLFLPINLPLAVVIAGFVLTNVAEARATRAGLMPTSYLWLRWCLTAVVVAVLTIVFVMRLVGAHVGAIG